MTQLQEHDVLPAREKAGPGSLTWSREAPLSRVSPSDEHVETWIARDNDERVLERWPVRVRVSKRFDAVQFKTPRVEQLQAAAHAITERVAHWSRAERHESIQVCPVCDAPAHECRMEVRRGRPRYWRCARCGHAAVSPRPTQADVERQLIDDDQVVSPYVDRGAIDQRLRWIVEPKLQWLLESLVRNGCVRPRTLLDIGAGGGHFVHAARAAGLAAEGVELSAAGRRFASEAFSLTLHNSWAPCGARCDVVCFWGSLQYFVNPIDPLRRAREMLHESGCVVLEVPRIDSMSTAVQESFPEQVTRHLDPTSHLHAFSDGSLATLLRRAQLQPIAAWYFGMDAFEWLINAAMRCEDDTVIDKLRQSIDALQRQLDSGGLSDGVAVIATKAPLTGSHGRNGHAS